MGAFSVIADLGRGLTDVVFPPRCIGCEAPIVFSGLPICPLCLHQIPAADQQELEAELDRHPGHTAGIGHVFALWLFQEHNLVQQLQYALKYGNRPRYGFHVGRLIGEALLRAGGTEADLIVPIPLHYRRFLERGYNQSAAIAEGIAAVTGLEAVPNLLTRIKATRSQTKLSRSERRENLSDAFGVGVPSAVVDKRIILVDDVITTGATLLSAAGALLSAGARGVDLVAMAHADHS